MTSRRRLTEAQWERRLLGYARLLADAALERDLFGKFVHRLTEDYPTTIGMLGYDQNRRLNGEYAFANVDEHDQRQYAAHFASVNPYPRIVRKNRLEDRTVIFSRYLPPAALRKTEYFNDFLRHGGGEFMFALSVDTPGFGRVSLSLDRSEAQGGDFDETDVRRFDSLRPFLRNALLLRALWREAGCPSGDPAEFVQSLRSAALVLKRQGHAEPLNEAAERRLSQRRGRRVDLTQGKLERLEAPSANSGKVPLRRFLQERFDLTPTQSAVACALADGLSYSEIAEEYGTSRATVHSHVKAIHEKAGVQSTLRFIALLNSLRHE